MLYYIGQTLLDDIPDLGIGEGEAVVAVDRRLDAAGPREGLIGAQKDGLDVHKKLGYLFFHYYISSVI